MTLEGLGLLVAGFMVGGMVATLVFSLKDERRKK